LYIMVKNWMLDGRCITRFLHITQLSYA